jgi:hypothetical protein
MKKILATCAMAAALVPLLSVAPVRADGEAGWLDVSSDPPAEIFVDDQDTKTVTPQHHVSLPAGHHNLKLVTTDGSRQRKIGFKVESGKGTTLTIHLGP